MPTVTPTVTDWLMVVITLVYVIATIAICIANLKAAKASREQLEEMKRQYADENRPRIDMEFCFERRTWYILRFINHGKQTAQKVKIELSQEFIDSLPEPTFKQTLEKAKGKECIIGIEKHYDLYIGSDALRGNPNMKPVMGTISYESQGNQFKEDIYLDLAQYMTFFSSTTDEENMQKTVKAIEKDLKGIKDVLIFQCEKSEDSEDA